MAITPMLQKPTIEMCIRAYGEHLHAVVMVHHQEIEPNLPKGIKRALSQIDEKIIEDASSS